MPIPKAWFHCEQRKRRARWHLVMSRTLLPIFTRLFVCCCKIVVVVVQEPKKNLKYLGLVHALVFQANAYLLALYIFAKDSSGPLRPGLDNVEGVVKTVVGPLYHKIEGKPLELLQFVDSKVCMFLGSSCHQVGAWIHPDAPWASPSLPCFECSKAEQKDPMTDTHFLKYLCLAVIILAAGRWNTGFVWRCGGSSVSERNSLPSLPCGHQASTWGS